MARSSPFSFLMAAPMRCRHHCTPPQRSATLWSPAPSRQPAKRAHFVCDECRGTRRFGGSDGFGQAPGMAYGRSQSRRAARCSSRRSRRRPHRLAPRMRTVGLPRVEGDWIDEELDGVADVCLDALGEEGDAWALRLDDLSTPGSYWLNPRCRAIWRATLQIPTRRRVAARRSTVEAPLGGADGEHEEEAVASRRYSTIWSPSRRHPPVATANCPPPLRPYPTSAYCRRLPPLRAAARRP